MLYLVVQVPCLIICLYTPPVENGPEVYFHQLPLRSMTDMSKYPEKRKQTHTLHSLNTKHDLDNDRTKTMLKEKSGEQIPHEDQSRE